MTDTLAAGGSAGRRRRRTVLAGAAAATALVMGGGFVATQNLTGSERSPEDTPVAGGAGDLTVTVEGGVPADVLALRDGADMYAAIWDPEAQRLVYVSRLGYSSSCPPDGALAVAQDGILVLELSTPSTRQPCTADARQATATITGLAAPPPELRVNEHDATRVVPVRESPARVGPSSAHVSVYTHCGVESVRIDGRWWHASPPLYDQERSGPPPGWGDPYQEGTLTMESADRAVFEALGQRVVFVPAPDDEPVRVCR